MLRSAQTFFCRPPTAPAAQAQCPAASHVKLHEGFKGAFDSFKDGLVIIDRQTPNQYEHETIIDVFGSVVENEFLWHASRMFKQQLMVFDSCRSSPHGLKMLFPESVCEGFFVKKHLQNYVSSTSSHLHIYISAHLHHLHTSTSLLISAHLHTSTSLLISAHLHLCSSSHLHIYISAHLHILTSTAHIFTSRSS